MGENTNGAQVTISETLLLKIAREVAIDLHDVEDILKRCGIDQAAWVYISRHPRFVELLNSERVAWESAVNTRERVAVKAAAMIEEWLPEAFSKLHSEREGLSAKTGLAELLAELAGMRSKQRSGDEPAGERFTVTINLGADHQLKIDKELANATPEVTIEERAIPFDTHEAGIIRQDVFEEVL